MPPEAVPESGQLAPEDVDKWRRETRKAFRDRRVALKGADRDEANARVTRHLLDAFGLLQGMTVGFYEPMHGEVDPWPAVQRLRHQGSYRAGRGGAAARSARVSRMASDVRMTVGPLGLRGPADSAPVILGHFSFRRWHSTDVATGWAGSSYFDRTLAAMQPQPLDRIGVRVVRIDTIHPQAHDIPMDFIVTEAAIYLVRERGIEMTHDCAHAAAGVPATARAYRRNREPSPAVPDVRRDTAREYASRLAWRANSILTTGTTEERIPGVRPAGTCHDRAPSLT